MRRSKEFFSSRPFSQHGHKEKLMNDLFSLPKEKVEEGKVWREKYDS